jgi:hypothetical protein
MSIPNRTGTKTTLEVAWMSVIPEMEMSVADTSSFTRAGVTTTASRVEQAVRTTESATSALAMSDTRLEAVPPNEKEKRRLIRICGACEKP